MKQRHFDPLWVRFSSRFLTPVVDRTPAGMVVRPVIGYSHGFPAIAHNAFGFPADDGIVR